MIDTRLILFDGIAGSGKTTNSQWLYVTLVKAGIAAQWITESQRDHPIYRREIAQARTTEEAIGIALAGWQQFVADGAALASLPIMDGSADNPISFLLLRDTPPERIALAVTAQAAAMRPLRPVLFQLYQDNVDAAIDTIIRRRGEGWRQHLVAYVASSPFAQNRQLSGIEAVRVYYREHRRIADLAFRDLAIGKTAINTSDGRWADYQATILDVLDIRVAAGSTPPVNLSALVGEYDDPERDGTWRITQADGALFLEGDTRLRLVHVDGGRFFIEGQPIELLFEGPDQGPAARVHYRSKASDGLKGELTWVRV